MSVFVIAEAGVNHNGNMRIAEHLIVAAKRAGADAVKFQLFDAEKLGRPELKPLQLSIGQMADLKAYADKQEIEFMCTPFHAGAITGLVNIGIKRLKISSGCIKDKLLLKIAAASAYPIILSTGMSDMGEVYEAIEALDPSKLTLLHCTSAYPCPISDVNLKAMLSMKKAFNVPVGYSDHTQGITIPIAATAMGATVIEKHLTLDRMMSGPDHAASIEPGEFRVMVSAIRTVEEAMGTGIKEPQPSEAETRKIWGRM